MLKQRKWHTFSLGVAGAACYGRQIVQCWRPGTAVGRPSTGAYKETKANHGRLDLVLNETKTHIVDARQDSFDFLGFEIKVRRSWKTGNRYTSVSPSSKALAKIKARMKELTARERTPIPLADIVGSMNASLRGWVNYFHFKNSSGTMGKVRTYTEERLRTHLRKRHKVKNWKTGYIRFPSKQLYERYGLYKVPTTAGWKSAHASV